LTSLLLTLIGLTADVFHPSKWKRKTKTAGLGWGLGVRCGGARAS